MKFAKLDYCQYLLSSPINDTVTNLAEHLADISQNWINRYLLFRVTVFTNSTEFVATNDLSHSPDAGQDACGVRVLHLILLTKLHCLVNR
jgi:hypothetical protein